MVNRVTIKLKKYLINIGWLFAGKIFRMLLSMVAGIWVARYLGAEMFGTLSFCMAVALLFRPVAIFQLEGICVRELITSPDKKNEILGSAFILSLGAGVLAFSAAMGFIHILHPDMKIYSAIVAIAGTGLMFFCFEILNSGFRQRSGQRQLYYQEQLFYALGQF